MKKNLRSRNNLIAFTLLVLTMLASCTHSKPAAETVNKDTTLKHYQLTGRVVAIDKPNKSLTIDGDEIPGFMSAMQMPYDVKDVTLLDKLATGDKISADVVVKDDESWLENIKVAQPAAPAPKPSSSLRIVKAGVA